MTKSGYYINENDEFIIEDYNRKKPFSSFLPAVSGLYGKPMWAYYVNRGQCMATFGVNNKDYSIMEFLPANKAYRQTAIQGFRTFLKVKKPDGSTVLYEPFRDIQTGGSRKISQRMRITSADFKLEDVNEDLGIRTEVLFCTLPGENIPGLIRQVKIENIGKEQVSVEVADGLAVIIPYYLINQDMKNESNLRQAWMSADMDEGLPFYRIKALPYDTAETVLLEGGNFYLNFHFEDETLHVSKTIVDPSLIFGHVTDFTYPAAFAEEDFQVPKEQVNVGYTPCGFGCRTITLRPGETDTCDTLIGSAPSFGRYQEFLKEKLKPGYIEEKIKENRELIERTKRHAFTASNSRAFDLYMGQTFMDNYLRGGYPVKVGNGKHIMYVYSRKHGDLEREYNFFQVDATNYSQGNANFRDVNQNRRNDVYFFPFTEESGIRTFFNLLQLDGFNPLVLNGSRFEVEDGEAVRKILENYFEEETGAKIEEMLAGAFTPGQLLLGMEQIPARVKQGTMDAFLNDLLEQCVKEDYATFQEGYWVDHWTYNIDLLEQFIEIYPDRAEQLIFGEADYTYYDNDAFVVPRAERYVLTKLGVRQYGAVQKVPEKTRMMEERTFRPNQVRTKKGTGEIYYCTLAAKILLLLVNKIASLDPMGMGLEMEGGKPGWCDALNGLPGIIGSSINESAEVRRLAVLMKGILDGVEEDTEILLPVEGKEFFDIIWNLLKDQVSGMDYWNASNDAKEAYRASITFGIDGEEKPVTAGQAKEFMEAVAARTGEGLARAYNEETGVYDTYFINEAVQYEVLKDGNGEELVSETGLPLVRVTRFRTRAIPPFLEGQVHMMRANPLISERLHEAVKKSGMYDDKLDMFKVNADIMEETKEIGRQNVFPRGWLENEAVFLHMEYKYFLELLRSGLCEEFAHYLKTSFIPALDASVYGRSILENSSFIASSAHPDERIHGGGYVSRLTGASAEMLTMWRMMTAGMAPFVLNEKRELCLKLAPKLPGWLFTEEDRERHIYTEAGEQSFVQPKGSFAFALLGSILTIYRNEERADTYGAGVSITKIDLYKNGELIRSFDGDTVPAPYAEQVRNGEFDRIEARITK
ncbi:MAG: hypothetical protein Q4C52_08305 [Eubacteriales bacterium]|nr:hypothetical protein [Eubacteriales bacterium]